MESFDTVFWGGSPKIPHQHHWPDQADLQQDCYFLGWIIKAAQTTQAVHLQGQKKKSILNKILQARDFT